MMKIRLLWVGKTRERFIAEGINKYLRLIRPYAVLEVEEIKEERGKPARMSMQKEAERLLRQAGTFILLDEKGRAMTSEDFARLLKANEAGGKMEFVLGGAYGVSEEVKQRATDIISLSPMTLTHEMARLVFLEQIYRAFTINVKKGYHHS